VLSETVGVASVHRWRLDVGTYQMAGSLPAGAIVLGSKLGPVTGFAGDTTAVLTSATAPTSIATTPARRPCSPRRRSASTAACRRA
jgi:hypothetical protein